MNHLHLLPAIKQRIGVVQLLEQFYQETEFRGPLTFCPFHTHHRNTPSFQVFDDGRYKCYACDAHGDVVDFLRTAYRMTHGHTLPFGKAVEALATIAGIELTPGDVETLSLAVESIQISDRRPPVDHVRQQMIREANLRLAPLIRAVRSSGTTGAGGMACELGEWLDRVCTATDFRVFLEGVGGVERVARRHLRMVEADAEVEIPEILNHPS